MADFSQYGTPSEEWRKVSNLVPAPHPGLSFIERREHSNRTREQLSADEMKIWEPLVQRKDHTIPTRDQSTIEARSYRPANADTTGKPPVLLYLHGGGFFSGTIATEDATCSRLAVHNNAIVLNVCYRHTPEHTYPTAWDDTHDAFEWLHDHIVDLGGDYQRVLVGGISSGAYLAASFVLEKHLGRRCVSRPAIAGQILMVPCLLNTSCHGPILKKFKDPAVCSLQQLCNAPTLPMSTFQMITKMLQIPDPKEEDLRLNPGYVSASRAEGLPPTVIVTAGMDILRDEGLLYAKTLTEASVPTDVHVVPGLPHAFAAIPGLSEGKQRWNKILDGAIVWALSKPTAKENFSIQAE
ncbi:hypothetical protein PFICI_09686 [Pestalotiopsis fici W106-1]|uniref:Alpha/beta hydrolase fold-3 domain-containing protein n=1 Tax=Pestalotiopsis fici (strain W106-1 / CGMCC3.15140) TaxID=1229662 RepID=W3WUY3_PESFW|nr:uncharacterized protein PFICI_09686 [Pestalotiopsis fici W106-1]ETS77624.1 hypothetical protein PFICI_09686 [Pestalotiopsis fici W106-1]